MNTIDVLQDNAVHANEEIARLKAEVERLTKEKNDLHDSWLAMYGRACTAEDKAMVHSCASLDASADESRERLARACGARDHFREFSEELQANAVRDNAEIARLKELVAGHCRGAQENSRVIAHLKAEKAEMQARLETMGASLAAVLARAERAEQERDDLLARVKRAELARWKAEADQEREVIAVRAQLKGALVVCPECEGVATSCRVRVCETCGGKRYVPAEQE